MEQQSDVSRVPSTAPKDKLSAPLLYLSSSNKGWEGLVAHAFHEPMELDAWISPASSDISLIVFAGGAMRMEQRPLHGSWRAQAMRQGDLILRAGIGTPYEVRWKGLSSLATQTLHLHLSKDLIARTAEEIAGAHAAHISIIARIGFQDALLTQIGFALWRELEQNAPAGKLYAHSVAQMLTVHLLRHYTSQAYNISAPKRGLTQQQISRVTDFVQSHLAHDLSLESLAQQTGFSAYHFTRLFRQTMGESPHQFVMRQRIECAQRLLAQQHMSLASIALACGFANQSHFTQVFKRYLGVTPRAYLQNYSIRADF